MSRRIHRGSRGFTRGEGGGGGGGLGVVWFIRVRVGSFRGT